MTIHHLKHSRSSNAANTKKGVILVTGSAGRIGSALVKRLGDEYRIVGFELLKALYASANEELVPVDLSSDESVAQAFHHIRAFYGKRITAVVHLAAYYSFDDQNYENYKKITVQGTERLLKALQGFEVGQFIFTSTMLVHKSSHHIISEKSPRKGSWAYPKSKIETEEVIHKHRGKIPTVILRVSGVYDDMCHSIPISNQIQRIYEKQFQSRFFPGDLKSGASFLHMDDLVEAIWLCIKKRKELPKETVLLLGEPKTLSTDDLQKEISYLLNGRKMKTWRIPKTFAWFGALFLNHMPFMRKPFIKPWMIWLADDNYVLDVSKAEKLLGWKPQHNLRDSLKVMISNMLKSPLTWYKMNGLRTSFHMLHKWKHERSRKRKQINKDREAA